MSESKEFLGKTLDAAIAEACSYYGVAREKLEIDIIEDAKTGIFGIVGARKARIRARIATLPDLLLKPEKAEKGEGRRGRGRGERRRDRAEEERPRQQERQTPPPAEESLPEPPAPAPVEQAAPEAEQPSAPAEAAAPEAAESRGRGRRQPRERRPAPAAPKPASEEREDGDASESGMPRRPLSELDAEKLSAAARGIVAKLVAPVLDVEPDSVELSVEITDDRVQISIKSEDTGLLIGRDGQNLAAVQYLASRMVTRVMEAQVRVQVDAGDYHMRQDTRLQELAFSLAEKVKATGKVQTTRPLSAYQRRVIHLALQDDPEIQTRSSGEGALKHVVILRRKD